jgi:DNA polymerase V
MARHKTISEIFKFDPSTKLGLPLYSSKIRAGFPSPADDYVEQKLDLNTFLIDHPASTFFVRVQGESMIGAGIFNNDLLIVDRSIEPANGRIIIAVVDQEFTVKRFYKIGQAVHLVPENKDFETIILSHEDQFSVWGVVTNVIHNVEIKSR